MPMLPGPRLTESEMRQALADPRADAARDRRLARDRPGLVRRRDRAVRARRPSLPARPRRRSRPGSALPCWPPPGGPSWRVPILFAAFAQSALHTINHLFDIGGTDPGWLGPSNFVALLLLTGAYAYLMQESGNLEQRGRTAQGRALVGAAARMRVFLAGATGVIGRRLLPHAARGRSRRDRDDAPRGARRGPARGRRDAGRLRRVRRRGPARRRWSARSRRSCVHELTDLPPTLDPRKMEEQAAGNDRIRTEGTRNLVAAAVAAGARRIVAQSIAFAYPPTGAGLKHEDDPLWDDAPWPWSRSVEALHELEDTVTKTEGIEGLVLRYGFFYGPGSAYAAGRVTSRARCASAAFRSSARAPACSRSSTSTTPPTPRWRRSSAARPASTTSSTTSPAPLREWLPVYAEAIGAKRPCRVPRLARAAAGGRVHGQLATELRGASNEKAKARARLAAALPELAGGLQGRAGLAGARRARAAAPPCPRPASAPARSRAPARAREMSIVHSCAESQ